MKKIILLISIILAITSMPVMADNIKVIPEVLTKKETEDFNSVNTASQVVFKNLKQKIKTSNFAPIYDDFPLFKDDYLTNNTYYYVKKGNIILIYDKSSKNLEFISIKKNNIPYARAFYEYPSGDLKYIKIWNNKTEWYMFNAKGEYVNYEPYIKAVRRHIAENLKLPNKIIFARKLSNQPIAPVRVSVVIDKSGKLISADIIEKSNLEEINQGVVKAIEKANPYKPFPEEFINKDITIMFKFNF